MNKALLFVFLFSIQALAGPRVIGNGGDVKEEFPVSLSYLQNLLADSQLFIRAWLQGLETQMVPDRHGSQPRTLAIPKGSEKLFQSFSKNIYRILEDTTIVYQTNSPCSSDKGQSDGSVLSEKPKKICISGYSLARKLNEGNAKIQLEALILHELSHFMGTTEEEAISIQSQYLEDMRFVSRESIVKYYDSLIEKIGAFDFVQTQAMILKKDDFEALCKAVTEASRTIQEVGRRSEITPISLFSAWRRDQLDNLNTALGSALYFYVCSQHPKHPVPWQMAEYVKGFQGKKRIEVSDWMAGRGYPQPKSTAQMVMTKIENQQDLIGEVLSIGIAVKAILSDLTFGWLWKFEVSIDEK